MANIQIVTTCPDRANLNTNGIRATYPVVGSTHKAAAVAVNWLLGRGHVLISDGPKIVPYHGEFSPPTHAWWIYRDSYHSSMNLQFTASSVSNLGYNVPLYVRTSVNGGAEQTFAVDNTPTTFNMRVDVTATNTDEEFSILFLNDHDPTVDSQTVDLIIHQIMLFECPNATIENAGLNYFTFAPKNPIYEDTDGVGSSITQLASAAAFAAHDVFRRGGLFTCASPESANVISVSGTTSYTPVYRVKPSIQAPLFVPGATTKTCKSKVRAALSGDATAGDVRITMTNGSTVTHHFTTSGWSSTQNLSVETDDPSQWATDGGIRGGTRDEATVECRVTGTGTNGNFTVLSVCIWDEPQ